MKDIFERDRCGEMVSPNDSGYDEALAAAAGVDTKGSWENPMA